MTPLEVNTAARQRYNAVADDFWSDAEIYNLMYQACLELATEGLLIERVFTTTSVASQQEYDWPTNAIAIKRIQYDGRKLMPFTFREDDVITNLNQAVTSTGTPSSYAVWNNVFYLRPIPSTSSLTVKVWAYVEPQPVSLNSTLEIPTEWHMSLVNFILSEMSAKNKNYQGAQYYRQLWEKDVVRAKRLARKKLIGDAFQVVKNIDIIPQTDLGNC
jgi:hypothetical protein